MAIFENVRNYFVSTLYSSMVMQLMMTDMCYGFSLYFINFLYIEIAYI